MYNLVEELKMIPYFFTYSKRPIMNSYIERSIFSFINFNVIIKQTGEGSPGGRRSLTSIWASGG